MIIRLNDRYSGQAVELNMRDGVVVGATGCEPRRYLGLTEDEARHYARYGQTSEAKRARPLLRIDGLHYRPLSARHRRIASALTTRPFASTSERMKVARRLARLGVTWINLPTGGWTSIGHLETAGWVP